MSGAHVAGTTYRARQSIQQCPRFHKSAQHRMKSGPVRLTWQQAGDVLEQFKETATFRGWLLVAAAVMANHCHVVVGVLGDPEPDTMLRDFKSYASRRLNKHWPRPTSGTWWTESGSRRRLKDELAILGATRYIRDQEYPLAVWIDPAFANELGKRE
jgi:REP element-mobilizing transposase RayT